MYLLSEIGIHGGERLTDLDALSLGSAAPGVLAEQI
jgi:hypothetical protein